MYKNITYSLFLMLSFLLGGCENKTQTIQLNHDFINVFPVFSNEPNWLDAVIVDEKNKDQIIVDASNVNFNRVGSYKVAYSAKGIKKKLILDVYIVDLIKPTITGVKNVTIEVNTELPDLLDGVELHDNYDQNLLLTEENVDTSKVNIHKLGDYTVIYKAYDHSGNVATEEITLTVKDHTAPVFIGLKDEVYVEAGLDYDFTNGITVTDNYDELYLTSDDVDLSELNIKKLGSYTITYQISDSSQNTTIKPVLVHVIDTTPPTIYTPYDIRTLIRVEPNYLAKISAVDNLDGPILLTKANLDTSLVNLNEASCYLVTINVKDATGNVAKKTLTVYVLNNETENVSIFTE